MYNLKNSELLKYAKLVSSKDIGHPLDNTEDALNLATELGITIATHDNNPGYKLTKSTKVFWKIYNPVRRTNKHYRLAHSHNDIIEEKMQVIRRLIVCAAYHIGKSECEM